MLLCTVEMSFFCCCVFFRMPPFSRACRLFRADKNFSRDEKYYPEGTKVAAGVLKVAQCLHDEHFKRVTAKTFIRKQRGNLISPGCITFGDLKPKVVGVFWRGEGVIQCHGFPPAGLLRGSTKTCSIQVRGANHGRSEHKSERYCAFAAPLCHVCQRSEWSFN